MKRLRFAHLRRDGLINWLRQGDPRWNALVEWYDSRHLGGDGIGCDKLGGDGLIEGKTTLSFGPLTSVQRVTLVQLLWRSRLWRVVVVVVVVMVVVVVFAGARAL